MSAPASALSTLADVAINGATIAAMVLVALVGMHAFKIMRKQILDEVMTDAMERTEFQYDREELENGYLDSSGNLYANEADRDEAEALMQQKSFMSADEKDAAWDDAVEVSRDEWNGTSRGGLTESEWDDAYEDYTEARMKNG